MNDMAHVGPCSSWREQVIAHVRRSYSVLGMRMSRYEGETRFDLSHPEVLPRAATRSVDPNLHWTGSVTLSELMNLVWSRVHCCSPFQHALATRYCKLSPWCPLN